MIRTLARVPLLTARPGDVLSYVHPEQRQIRHHRLAAVELRTMDRLTWPQGLTKPSMTERRRERTAYLMQPHPHELDRPVWVCAEDVLCCWRAAGPRLTPAPGCWRSV